MAVPSLEVDGRQLESGVGVERMWVRVTGYTDSGYIGELKTGEYEE